MATIGRCYYWSHTSGRSVRLYTGECVVDSSMGLWDRANVYPVNIHITVKAYLFPLEEGVKSPIRSMEINSIGAIGAEKCPETYFTGNMFYF